MRFGGNRPRSSALVISRFNWGIRCRANNRNLILRSALLWYILGGGACEVELAGHPLRPLLPEIALLHDVVDEPLMGLVEIHQIVHAIQGCLRS